MKKSILLLSLIAIFGFSLTNCGGQDKPDPTDNTNTVEEFLTINGVKLTADQIVSKYLTQDNVNSRLEIETSNGQYPWFVITHERNPSGDTLVPRIYKPGDVALYLPDFDTYDVKLFYAEGAPPIDCQFNTTDNSTGTYELKKDGDKFISEFSNVSLDCTSGGSQSGSITVSGNLVWEEK